MPTQGRACPGLIYKRPTTLASTELVRVCHYKVEGRINKRSHRTLVHSHPPQLENGAQSIATDLGHSYQPKR